MKIRALAAVCTALFIAGCNQNPLEVVVSRCPAVAVVGDVGTLTRFSDPAQTSDDLSFTATISQVVWQCEQGERVDNEVTFSIIGQAGPALVEKTQRVQYFVAVMRDNSQLVSKQVFDAELAFTDAGTAETEEIVRQLIPTIDQARRYNYEVLLGFQITADDALFNIQR